MYMKRAVFKGAGFHLNQHSVFVLSYSSPLFLSLSLSLCVCPLLLFPLLLSVCVSLFLSMWLCFALSFFGVSSKLGCASEEA